MPYDLALSAKTHDLIFKDNSFLLIDNAERVAQQIKIALLEWRGEWFLDSRDGIPYLEYILIKNPNKNHIRSILTTAITNVEGVIGVSDMILDLDVKTRKLTVSYTANTDYGLVTSREVLGYGN